MIDLVHTVNTSPAGAAREPSVQPKAERWVTWEKQFESVGTASSHFFRSLTTCAVTGCPIHTTEEMAGLPSGIRPFFNRRRDRRQYVGKAKPASPNLYEPSIFR